MIESTFTRGPLSPGVGIWNRNMNAPEIIRQPPAPDSQEAHDQVEEKFIFVFFEHFFTKSIHRIYFLQVFL